MCENRAGRAPSPKTRIRARATLGDAHSTDDPDMQIALPARAENIAIVRHAFGALEDAYALDAQTLSDIRLAVTEACTNVVVHAYPDGSEGPMEVFATLLGDELTVVVRDEGTGIGPRPDSPGLGLGLPLIASLTESVRLGRDEEERTEVRMTFSLSDAPTTTTTHPLRPSSAWPTPGSPVSEEPHSPDAATRQRAAGRGIDTCAGANGRTAAGSARSYGVAACWPRARWWGPVLCRVVSMCSPGELPDGSHG